MNNVVTAHALVRYLERALGFDLSRDRREAAAAMGLAGPGWLKDGDLLRHLEARMPLAEHRTALARAVVAGHVVDERVGENLVLMRNGFVAVVTEPGSVVVTVMRYVVPEYGTGE